MTSKQIKKLAKASYTRSILDSKKVNKIVKFLNRSGLKTYIKCLKVLERSKTVQILIPNVGTKNEIIDKLKKMFPNKKLEFIEDRSLIAGIRIVDNDNVYDFNLKNTFDNLISYINQ